MRPLYLPRAGYPVFSSLLDTKMLINRYNQSTWYLIYSQPTDFPLWTISAQVQIRASKTSRVPEEQVGFMCLEGQKKAVKITHLCFCQVEDNKKSLNLSFKGNQDQALVKDPCNSRYSCATLDIHVQKVNRERWYLSDNLKEMKLKILMRCF